MATSVPCLLHIDSGFDRAESVSRELATRFVESWRAVHPDGTVMYRDLCADPVPHADEPGWVAGMMPAEHHAPDHAASWAVSLPLIEELEAATEYLFTVPMFNLSVPSVFKAWLDRVVVVGRTLMLDDTPAPLRGRRVTVISTRGGAYGPGTPREGMNHQEPHLRSLFGMMGLDDVDFIAAELTLAAVDPNMAFLKDAAAASLEDARERAANRPREIAGAIG